MLFKNFLSLLFTRSSFKNLWVSLVVNMDERPEGSAREELNRSSCLSSLEYSGPECVLQDCMKELELVLSGIDLVTICDQFMKYGIITREFCTRFGSLDHVNLDKGRRTRYLLQHITDQVNDDDTILSLVLEMLCSYSRNISLHKTLCVKLKAAGYNVLLQGMTGNDEFYSQPLECFYLKESHIPQIMEAVVEGSYKWEEFSIALSMPRHLTEECRSSGNSNVLRFTNVLDIWITRKHERMPTATLDNLKKALASTMVGLGNLYSNNIYVYLLKW